MAKINSDKKELLEVLIVNPDKILYEGEAIRVFVPGPFGEMAFLPGHAPLYSEIVEGEIKIIEKNNKEVKKKIDVGIVRTKGNSIKILVGF